MLTNSTHLACCFFKLEARSVMLEWNFELKSDLSQAMSWPTLISTFELSWLRVLLLGQCQPSHCDSSVERMPESFVKPAWKHTKKTSTWSCLHHQKLKVSSLNAKGLSRCWFGRQLVHWALNPLVPVPEPPQKRINFLFVWQFQFWGHCVPSFHLHQTVEPRITLSVR